MPRSFGLAAFVLFLLFSSATQSPAESETTLEQFAASAFVTGTSASPPTGRTILPQDFFVYSYTPDDEFQNLVNLFNTEGEAGMEKAFSKMKERGRISPGFRTSQGSFRLIRSTTSGNNTVIRMAMERILSPAELTSASVQSTYRFSVVELHVDAQGKGEGTFIYRAKLKFNKQGGWETENFSADPIRLLNVRKLK